MTSLSGLDAARAAAAATVWMALGSACGWQLDTGPSARLSETVVVRAQSTVGIEKELEFQLGRSPGATRKNESETGGRLHLLVENEAMFRRISAVDGQGLAAEFELTLSVEVSASAESGGHGPAELGAKTFEASRRQLVDTRTSLATEWERSTLAHEMRRELATRILEWLSVLAAEQPQT